MSIKTGPRQFTAIPRVKFSEDGGVFFHPDWSHASAWEIHVGQMPDAPPTLANGQENRHRSAWAPFVLLGQERPRNEYSLCAAFNPRAARYFARKLLEAADACERLEFEMGWHPSQDASGSLNRNPASEEVPKDDSHEPHRLSSFERLAGDDSV
jgi:hypothetical protein